MAPLRRHADRDCLTNFYNDFEATTTTRHRGGVSAPLLLPELRVSSLDTLQSDVASNEVLDEQSTPFSNSRGFK